jgi:hypothetical protein
LRFCWGVSISAGELRFCWGVSISAGGVVGQFDFLTLIEKKHQTNDFAEARPCTQKSGFQSGLLSALLNS